MVAARSATLSRRFWSSDRGKCADDSACRRNHGLCRHIASAGQTGRARAELTVDRSQTADDRRQRFEVELVLHNGKVDLADDPVNGDDQVQAGIVDLNLKRHGGAVRLPRFVDCLLGAVKRQLRTFLLIPSVSAVSRTLAIAFSTFEI